MDWKLRTAAIWITVVIIGVFVIAGLIGTIEFVSSLLAEKEEPVSFKSDFKVDITEAEGRVMHVYKDSRGILTGGIGHKLTSIDRVTLDWEHTVPNETVEQWFDIDYMKMEHGVNKYFPDFDEWPRLAQLAVGNWLWQLGADAPKNFPRATHALQEKRWSDAAEEWLYSNPRTKHWSKWRKETQHRCEQEAERLTHVANGGSQ